jgi:hypothetical protein
MNDPDWANITVPFVSSMRGFGAERIGSTARDRRQPYLHPLPRFIRARAENITSARSWISSYPINSLIVRAFSSSAIASKG